MDAVRGPDSIRCCNAGQAADGHCPAEAILTHLVETYQTPLKHICYMILHDESLAEDAVQETFLKAYKGLESFRGQSSEKTWLMRIGVNVCRDMRRGRWFRYVDRRIALETLPLPAAEKDDDHEDLAQAIVLLPDKYKEVILLHYYQNMNVREVAQALGLAPSSVSNRLKKAREKLRALMERGNVHG